MPLEEILAALRRDGDDEVARITADRDAAVAAVMQSAHERAREVEASAATARDGALARETEVIRHRAELQVVRRLQDERESVFQEILGQARQRLANYRNDPDYPATIEALLEECRAFLGTIEVVMVDPRDAELVGAALHRFGPAQLQPSLESWGGVVAHNGKGVFVRNTLEERLGQAEVDLRQQIGQLVPGLDGRSERGAQP